MIQVIVLVMICMKTLKILASAHKQNFMVIAK